MRSSLATTRDDLARTLRLSLMVTPQKSPLLEAIDTAISQCRNERVNAPDTIRFNAICDALDKLYEARRLVGGRP